MQRSGSQPGPGWIRVTNWGLTRLLFSRWDGQEKAVLAPALAHQETMIDAKEREEMEEMIEIDPRERVRAMSFSVTEEIMHAVGVAVVRRNGIQAPVEEVLHLLVDETALDEVLHDIAIVGALAEALAEAPEQVLGTGALADIVEAPEGETRLLVGVAIAQEKGAVGKEEGRHLKDSLLLLGDVVLLINRQNLPLLDQLLSLGSQLLERLVKNFWMKGSDCARKSQIKTQKFMQARMKTMSFERAKGRSCSHAQLCNAETLLAIERFFFPGFLLSYVGCCNNGTSETATHQRIPRSRKLKDICIVAIDLLLTFHHKARLIIHLDHFWQAGKDGKGGKEGRGEKDGKGDGEGRRPKEEADGGRDDRRGAGAEGETPKGGGGGPDGDGGGGGGTGRPSGECAAFVDGVDLEEEAEPEAGGKASAAAAHRGRGWVLGWRGGPWACGHESERQRGLLRASPTPPPAPRPPGGGQGPPAPT